MRPTVLTIAAVLTLAVPAAAAWKEYPQPQLGFVVEFPAEPALSTGTYRTVLIPSAAVHIYSARDERALYVATVVDLLDRKEEGASLLGEAEFNLTMLGDVSGVSPSRVEPGTAAVFGRFITIDCRSTKVGDQPGQAEAAHRWLKNIAGIECPDRSRLTVNMFFHRGRMYLIHGLSPRLDDGSFGPAALRFANSISFYAADGSRNALDGVQ